MLRGVLRNSCSENFGKTPGKLHVAVFNLVKLQNAALQFY